MFSQNGAISHDRQLQFFLIKEQSSEFFILHIQFFFFLTSGIAMGENAMASWIWGMAMAPFVARGNPLMDPPF